MHPTVRWVEWYTWVEAFDQIAHVKSEAIYLCGREVFVLDSGERRAQLSEAAIFVNAISRF